MRTIDQSVRVTLLADPPMGDVFARKLRDLDVVELHYVRGKRTNAIPALPVGTRWVLAMNAGHAGAAIKEAARKLGARYVPVPPSWAAARNMLEADGFFREIRAADSLAEVCQGPGISVATSPALEAIAKQAKEQSRGPMIESDAPPVARPPQGPPKVVEVKRREVLPVAQAKPDPIRERVQQIAAKGQPAVAPSAPGPTDARRRAAEQLARQMIEANPEVSGVEVLNALRELLGVAIASPELYRLRREIRAAHGLDPSGRSRSLHRNALALGRSAARRTGLPSAQVPPIVSPALAPRATGVLGADSQAAIDLLCATLPRDGVRGLVVTFDANGAPHVEVELAVLRTETVAYTPKGP